MAHILSVGDIVEVKAFCYCINQVGINISHWVCTAASGVPTDEDFLTTFEAAAAPLYKAVMSNIATWEGASAQVISTTPVGAVQTDTTNKGIGSLPGPTLPLQVTAVLTKRTAFGGRKYRGRLYIPFMDASLNDAPTESPTAAANILLQNLGDFYADEMMVTVGMNTATMTPTLYHRADGTDTLISEVVATGKWGTQRRRGNYGQANSYPPISPL